MQFNSQHTDLQPRLLIFLCLPPARLLNSTIVCPIWSYSSTASVFFSPQLSSSYITHPLPSSSSFLRIIPRCLQFPSLEPTQPAPGVFECSALWNSRPLDSNLPTPLNRHSLDRRFVANILICMREGKNVTWLVKGLVHNWSVFMLCAECNEKRTVRETAVDFHVCISWL